MSGKLLNVIIYQDRLRPRLFKIGSNKIRLFYYIIPLLLFIAVSFLLAIAIYFQELKLQQQHHESITLQQIKTDKQQLLQQLIEIKKENKLLKKKLLTPLSDSLTSSIALFAPIPGQKDLTGEGKSQIDNFKIKREVDKLIVEFAITNLTNGKERLSGHIFGIAKGKNAYYFYPESALQAKQHQIYFNRGESFATYRFRPSKITFNIKNNIPIDLIELFIFSRTGDLLIHKLYSFNEQEEL